MPSERCTSIFMVDRSKQGELAFYYRCVLDLEHAGRHQGTRIDERGVDIEPPEQGPGNVRWAARQSLNQGRSALPQHPQDPDQLLLDQETS